MSTSKTFLDVNVPAISVPMTGQHLIEASAGTGKTWTLTGIVLRLLIEAKRPPEHIICTTFTRAASAEMQERIRERLLTFYKLLNWLQTLAANQTNWVWLYPHTQTNTSDHTQTTTPANANNTQVQSSNSLNSLNNNPKQSPYHPLTPAHIQTMLQQLEQAAERAGVSDAFSDPINQHLLIYLLSKVTDYPLNEAIRRTQLLLISMDHLFVGTLDSLAQKWLSEYSAETGYQQGISMCEDDQSVVESIIHDALRAYQSHLYHHQPKVFELLQASNRLTNMSQHIASANKALQFMSVPIDTVEIKEFDITRFEELAQQTNPQNIADITPYFDKNYRKQQKINGRTSFAKLMHCIPTLLECIQQHGIHYPDYLQKQEQGLVKALRAFFEEGKGFNDGAGHEEYTFKQLPSIQHLQAVFAGSEALTTFLDNNILALNRHIAQTVRTKLPMVLAERQQTTFALQMVRLNQALAGSQGAKLAQYIRHHYPVALIDESQDINSEQASMLRRIYLSALSINAQRGFLLLVGDPKQAIYGFRGGDVANYNAMKTLFKQVMTLDVNHRSRQQLVEALNHWFAVTPKPTEQLNQADVTSSQSVPSNQSVSSTQSKQPQWLSQLGDGIYYQYITAKRQHSKLHWCQAAAISAKQTPIANSTDTNTNTSGRAGMQTVFPESAVCVLHKKYEKNPTYDEYQLMARHIHSLLMANHRLDSRQLNPSDIAILGRSHKDLTAAQQALTALGIDSIKPTDASVFASAMATELLCLLQAIANPYHTAIVNRAMTSQCYGFTLKQVQALQHTEGGSQTYQAFQQYLKQAAKIWQQKGILSSLQYLLTHPPSTGLTKAEKINQADADFGQQGVWHVLAKQESAQRNLIDLRHLLDIMAQHTRTMGMYETIQWVKKQLSSQPDADWAKQHPIPTQAGVQLMTIHKSKGLEFPIVYVLGMTSSAKKTKSTQSFELYLYHANQQASTSNQTSEPEPASDLASESVSELTAISTSTLTSPESSSLKTLAHGQRRLSATKGNHSDANYYRELVDKENLGEQKRLFYVAMTRASEQLFLVVKDHDKRPSHIDYRALNLWLGCMYTATYQLPPRLLEQIGWIYEKPILDVHQTLLDNQQAQQLIKNTDETASVPINYPSYDAVMRKKYFMGWAKTSFTALSRNLDKQHQDTAVNLPDYDAFAAHTPNLQLAEEEHLHQADTTITENNIRFTFTKGANAGSFLHQILEQIDFADTTYWHEVIDKNVQEFDLPQSYSSQHIDGKIQQNSTVQQLSNQGNQNLNTQTSQYAQLAQWIYDVLASPLLASGICLNNIQPQQKLPELGFNMGLGNHFNPQQINNVFAKHLGSDSDKMISLASNLSNNLSNNKQDNTGFYRYLRGEIDLVYQHAGKFYVVDYKSNFLGGSLLDYSEAHLKHAMSHAGYWLQAAIYQVALHRLLSIRIKGYQDNPSQYLGAVEYVFLRGCVAGNTTNTAANNNTNANDDANTNNSHRYGKICWNIPIELIKDLDRVFGGV